MSRRRTAKCAGARFIPSKRLMLGNDAIDYCADLSALISTTTCATAGKTNGAWTGSPKARCSKRQRGALVNALPPAEGSGGAIRRRLHEVERRNDMNLDAAANLSRRNARRTVRLEKGRLRAGFARTGLYLGKFIYLCDSFGDVEQDIKKRRITIPSSSGLKGRNLRLRAA